MKNIILSIALLVVISASEAAPQNLPKKQKKQQIDTTVNLVHVPLCGQINTMLCWAASIKMIAETHAKILSFKDIISTRNMSIVKSDFSEECSLSNFIEGHTNLGTLDYNIDIEGDDDKRFEMQSILLDLGFYANEDYKLKDFTWELCKNQLDNCRPFLISISMGSDDSRHYVVVKGYWTEATNHYLLIHDPWGNSPCNGEAYSLNFEQLIRNSTINHLHNFVINIRLKNDFKSTSCTKASKTNTVVAYQTKSIDSLKNVSCIPVTITKPIKELSISNGSDGYTINTYQLRDYIIDSKTVYRCQFFKEKGWQIIKIMDNIYAKSTILPNETIIVPNAFTTFFKFNDGVSSQYDLNTRISEPQFSEVLKSQAINQVALNKNRKIDKEVLKKTSELDQLKQRIPNQFINTKIEHLNFEINQLMNDKQELK